MRILRAQRAATAVRHSKDLHGHGGEVVDPLVLVGASTKVDLSDAATPFDFTTRLAQ